MDNKNQNDIEDNKKNVKKKKIKKVNCNDCVNYFDCPKMKGKKCEGTEKETKKE